MTSTMGGRALVLGGGGSAGHAWVVGVLAGLADEGADVTEADLVIGTSSGATATAQVASGVRPTELLAGILRTVPRPRNPAPHADRAHTDRPVVDHLERTSRVIAAA